MNSNTKVTALTPRQSAFLRAYSSPDSPSFGNTYQSALAAGYSTQTARNFTPKRTAWMSDIVGQMAENTAITQEQIMTRLTEIINDPTEPTIIKLKSIELTMKAYNMLAQRRETAPKVVTLNVDLTGAMATPSTE
jgi:phage terminase small subunit